MANKTKAELVTQANEIKNETIRGANTANRVGTMFKDLIDSTTTGGGVYAMDLDNASVIINNAGLYYVATPPSNGINFDDPTNYEGQIIYLVNQTGDIATILDNGFLPRNMDGTTQDTLGTQTTYIICSFNGRWNIITQFIV